jgi:predicted site-specific integrase-resolvase
MDTHTAILIDLDNAAILLSISRRRLARLVREGKVPVVELGDGEPRFEPARLRDWARSLSRPAGDAS